MISDDAGKTAARLYLVWALARTLRNALEGILGVAAPERMDEPPGEDEAA
ncbi:MAG TPA: DALR anticodon-binding domain-containing protein [Myxococcales bacterium]|nr:DALR anticodon-binding domain-containing protein [Myxococcales bacterium]